MSPLLANVLLDEVDQELERRGHSFVRYADDCNVYVRSKRAGERVMQALQGMYRRLRLRINEKKSAVARPWERKFLGYSFWVAPGRVVKRKVAPRALETMRQRVRQITRRTRGRNLQAVIGELARYLNGWWQYFRLSETPNVFRETDQWIRRRLRVMQLQHWGRRGTTVYRELTKRGLERGLALRVARYRRHWWAFAKSKGVSIALPVQYYDQMGLPRLAR